MRPSPDLLTRARAYAVHLYTASGVAFALLATAELMAESPRPRWVFAWLAVAVLVDATDGPLARRFDVKRLAAQIDGRTIDDLVDYLTFTFVPLLLVARLNWVPDPPLLWIVPGLLASLLGFAHAEAKCEQEGFFRGFPSYWNIYAFYAGPWALAAGPLGPGLLLLVLALLTVAPVRFVYPNLAPLPWRRPLWAGAAVWAALLLWMLPTYPQPPRWLLLVSLVYPAFYVGLSLWLDWQSRRSHD